MSKAVVFVTGRNPAHGKGGGSGYVRAHMRAAARAGCEPHVFCIDAESGTSEESFGVVHRVEPAPPFHRVLGDAPLRRRLGGAARATFTARFSPDAFAAAIGAAYAEVRAEIG